MLSLSSFIAVSVLIVLNMPCATSFCFNLTSFHDLGGDRVVQGDTYITAKEGHVELTMKGLGQRASNSSGAVYSSLLPLWDVASGEVAHFSTHFSFTFNSLRNRNPGGLAFILADPNIYETLSSHPFAVEIDAVPNSFDRSYEHSSAREIDVWIRYDSVAHNITVAFTGYNRSQQYLLHHQVDLARLLPDKVHFGFAVARGIVFELHNIKLRYFNSSLTVALPPTPSYESPVSVPNRVARLPAASQLGPHHTNNIVFLVGLSIGIVTFLVGLTIGIVTFLVLIVISVRLLLLPRTSNGNAEDAADQTGDGAQSDVTDQFYTITDLSSSGIAEQESDQSSVGEPGEEQRELGGEMDEAGPSNRYGCDSCLMDDELESCRGARKYSYAELARATNDFNPQEKLGGGGFGNVYKGELGTLNVAVKVSKGSEQEAKQYASEVKIISQVRHKNLVKLLGWCHAQDKLLLVYELVTNGSLDSHIFDTQNLLPFGARYEIVLDLADALCYLHEGLDKYVVHRDIKSSNILLDADYRPKLADFGLARLVHREKWEHTTDLAGTLGYLAPECPVTGRASKQADVYSFGVVVLEIVCGRRATWYPNGVQSNHKGLVHWVWELYGTRKLLDAVDPKLGGGAFDKKKITRLLMVGLLCVNPKWESRLTIGQALQFLKNESSKKLPRLPSKMPTPTY